MPIRSFGFLAELRLKQRKCFGRKQTRVCDDQRFSHADPWKPRGQFGNDARAIESSGRKGKAGNKAHRIKCSMKLFKTRGARGVGRKDESLASKSKFAFS